MNFIPNTLEEQERMLKAIGVKAFEELLADIPLEIRVDKLDLPPALSEFELVRLMQKIGGRNQRVDQCISFLGAGAYEHFIPSVVDYIISRGEFSTCYTPYQAEVSQGTLQAIYEYQSLICELTGMDVANASMYDGGSALAEAAILATEATRRKKIIISSAVHPEYRRVLRTYTRALDIEIKEIPFDSKIGTTDLNQLEKALDEETAAVILQQPNFFGCLESDLRAISERAHLQGALFIVSVNPISLGILKPPAEYYADIVIGEGQPLGNPLYFGGPYLGFFAGYEKLIRKMPGRLVGMTQDTEGRRGFMLVVQTREQHIKREKATSNICSNEALNALAACVYLSLLGKRGMQELAFLNVQKSHYFQEMLQKIGFEARFSAPFFNEFAARSSSFKRTGGLQGQLQNFHTNLGLSLARFYPSLDDCLLLCVTETKSKTDLDMFLNLLARFSHYKGRLDFSLDYSEHPALLTQEDSGVMASGETAQTEIQGGKVFEPLIFEMSVPGRRGYSLPKCDVPQKPLTELIPKSLLRSYPPNLPELSERDVVRHFTRLSQLNFSVDTGFYPLGSCTMKYNPKVNEKIAGLPGFTNLHPYQPERFSQGILQILYETEEYLSEICGMDKFSLQPAAGAHGEMLGMLMIRAYHEKNGNPRKKVVVPDSSHGTNPASAARCGYEVVTIKSNQDGEVDLESLQEALDEDVAAFMITNPNTLGIFESNITEIAEMIHSVGALLYLDGANMNALLGICRSGDMGIDVVHLNLHKTFSTPHGGGGPGSGPVGVKKELIPFLPVPLIEKNNRGYYLEYNLPDSVGKISVFYGNIGVIVKAYAYIRALGEAGLKEVSKSAIINANYLMEKLKEHFHLPYDRKCMHEFVLSLLREKKEREITARDVAKRLLDYGFHPPTMYFPLIVEEALMIEPTETESRETLDAFIEAMRKIALEIRNSPELVGDAPINLSFSRLDEKAAGRQLNLRWRDI